MGAATRDIDIEYSYGQIAAGAATRDRAAALSEMRALPGASVTFSQTYTTQLSLPTPNAMLNIPHASWPLTLDARQSTHTWIDSQASAWQ